MDDPYRVPPGGPALGDHATQVALHRYQYGAWLLLLAGVALLGAFLAGVASYESLPKEAPLGDVIGWLIVVAGLGSLLVIPAGLVWRKARRWRRVLAKHAWRAVRYRYAERVRITTDTTSEGTGPSTFVVGQLTILDPSAADETSPRWVNLDSMWMLWGKWRLRPWRQARKGVAWIAGDLSNAVVVALPGPGRLFGGHGVHWTSHLWGSPP